MSDLEYKEINQLVAATMLENADLLLLEQGGISKKIQFSEFVSSLAAAVGAILSPPGKIAAYGAAAAPSGWLLCDGSIVSRETYADLFAAIGETWGAGDGLTTFQLPDLRGVIPRGAGTTDRVAGVDAAGNAYTATLGAYAQDKMGGHKHKDPYAGLDTVAPVTGCDLIAGQPSIREGFGDTGRTYNVTTTSPYTDGTNGIPRTGAETAPATAGVTYIIKT